MTVDASQLKLLQRRQQQLAALVDPLPGAQPYLSRRPLNVAAAFDGLCVLDFLDRRHPHVGRETWRQKIADGHVVRAEGQLPVTPQDRVRAGLQLEHLQPDTVEPDVSAEIRFLYEDDQLLVLGKPAPLPLHACGRFQRNTLQWLLERIYHPQAPGLVHRLDADTSGVMVLGRQPQMTRCLQQQFQEHQVRKQYVARVEGHPRETMFVCEAPISARPVHGSFRRIDSEGQAARTRFEVLQRLPDGSSLIAAEPVTGRTNQIRLHLHHLGFPVWNDPIAGRGPQAEGPVTRGIDAAPLGLHAWQIGVRDLSGTWRQFGAPLPAWCEGLLPDERPHA